MPTSAHAECTDFTKISGESVTAQWADVGIGPYRTRDQSLPLPRGARQGEA